jgi:osmotically-inducible protein OsmY
MKTAAQLRTGDAATLAWDPSIRASQVGVAVQNGVSTLTGVVGGRKGSTLKPAVTPGDVTLVGPPTGPGP